MDTASHLATNEKEPKLSTSKEIKLEKLCKNDNPLWSSDTSPISSTMPRASYLSGFKDWREFRTEELILGAFSVFQRILLIPMF